MATTQEPRLASGQYGPGEFVQQVFDHDRVAPPEVLRKNSTISMGTEDIPRERYLSQEWHDLEIDRMWKRTWQVACREEDIPNPGDVVVYEIAEMSLMVVRVNADQIKAYHNTCLHRGRRLRTADGCASEIRCPYHGWTWDLDGRISTVPSAWDFPHVNWETFSLPEAQVGVWNGFVFINMDLSAEPLEEYLGDFVDDWSDWPTTPRIKQAHVVKVIRCNWKLALEAFLEAYHSITTHPQILINTCDELTEYDIYADQPHYSRLVGLRGIPSPHLDWQPTEQEILDSMFPGHKRVSEGDETANGGSARSIAADRVRTHYSKVAGKDVACSDAEAIDAIQYFVFPNFAPWGGCSQIVYRFRPYGSDPGMCLMDVMLLGPYDPDQPPTAAHPIVLGPDEPWSSVPGLSWYAEVFDQDTSNLAATQKGLAGSPRSGVVLSNYQESRIRHFHQTLCRYLDEE